MMSMREREGKLYNNLHFSLVNTNIAVLYHEPILTIGKVKTNSNFLFHYSLLSNLHYLHSLIYVLNMSHYVKLPTAKTLKTVW